MITSRNGVGWARISALLLSTSLLWGQATSTGEMTTGSWLPVMQIRAGAEVTVKIAGRKKHLRGRFVGGTADALQISEKGSVQSIARPEVMRVQVGRKRRAKSAAIGAAVGGGLGAGALGGIVAATNKRDAESGYVELFAAVGLGIGAAVGMVVGMVSGAGSETVYQQVPGPGGKGN